MGATNASYYITVRRWRVQRRGAGMDFKIRTLECKGKMVKLQLWDTAGQERFHGIVETYFRRAHGVLLVYDISNRASFTNISRWMMRIEEHAPSGIFKILVGNKCDLEGKRAVEWEDGERLAKQNGVDFIETSARLGINIDEAFHKIAELMADAIYTLHRAKEPDLGRIILEPTPIPKPQSQSKAISLTRMHFEAKAVVKRRCFS